MKKLKIAAACTALALVPASANAGVIVQSFSVLTPFKASMMTAGSTEFDQFDPALGTLNAVSFEHFMYPYDLIYYSINDYMFYYLMSPTYVNLLSGNSRGYQEGVNFGSPDIINVYDPNVSAYVGTGKLSLITVISKSNPNSFVNTFEATGKVFYHYTEAAPATAPEPSTWAMMLLGFGGAGAALRRRREASA